MQLPSSSRYLAGLAIALNAIVRPAVAAPLHSIEIVDRISKFEVFYARATDEHLEGDALWGAWKKGYGIAAVPPGPDGDAMARKLLMDAWPKYPALVPQLPALHTKAETDAHEAFDKINSLLATGDTPIHSRLVLYVGQFDNNAYTMPAMNGQPPTVMMSVENAQLRLILAHELVHSVHFQLAHVQNSFGAPIGETMFLEGLAMRAAQQVFPGFPDAAYTEMPGVDGAGWLETCRRNKDAILAGIAPDLDKSGRDIAIKYTFGHGNTGMQREVYCAAWIVMGNLIRSGETLSGLARIPESRMVSVMQDALAHR